MANETPTRGQIERTIGQKLQALYRERTGQRPEKVTCQFFDEKLAIVLEQISTPAERFLIEAGQQEIAQLFRSELENQMKAETIALIEEAATATVVDVLSSTNLQAGVSALVAILKEPPSVRDPESIPKVKRRNGTERSSEETPE